MAGRGLYPALAAAALLLRCPPALAAEEAAPAAVPPGMGGAALEMLAALALVLGVLVGLYWLARRFLPGVTAGPGGGLRVAGRLGIGSRKQVVLVSLGQRLLVLGVSPDRVNLLTTLDDQAEIAKITAGCGGFAKALKKAARKKEGPA